MIQDSSAQSTRYLQLSSDVICYLREMLLDIGGVSGPILTNLLGPFIAFFSNSELFIYPPMKEIILIRHGEDHE